MTNFTFSTSSSSRAPESRGARTVCQMIGHLTLGRIVARVLDGARVLTTFVDAGTVRRTISICTTIDRCTGHVWITVKSDGACADGFVADAGAFGVSAAGKVVGAADGGAVTAAACVRLFAFAVRLAANLDEEELKWFKCNGKKKTV